MGNEINAVTAAVTDDNLPTHAVVVLAEEGVESSDGRWLAPGGGTWRDPPLTMTVNHDPDQRVGSIDAIGRVSDLAAFTEAVRTSDDIVVAFDEAVGDEGSYIVGLVRFDLGVAGGEIVDPDAPGRRVAREVRDGFLSGVSIEIGDTITEFECVETVTDGDDEWCAEWMTRFLQYRIGAASFAPFQAVENARTIDVGVTASLSLSDAPPRDWFTDPQFDEATPITVLDSGRILGHIALWGTCHIGHQDVCLTPPHSRSNYAQFLTGEVVCADGSRVPVGTITMNTTHPPLHLSARHAVEHYEHTGIQAARVACGEDGHGIWISGQVDPDLDARQVRALMASAMSGDWRRIGGNLELVAVLAVNVPGFPVPRAAVASGAQTALVAAGVMRSAGCGCDHGRGLERRVAALEALIELAGLEHHILADLEARIR